MTLLRLTLKLTESDKFSIQVDGGETSISTLPFFDQESNKLYTVLKILNDVNLKSLNPEERNWMVQESLIDDIANHEIVVSKIGQKIFNSLFPDNVKTKLNLERHHEFLHIQICYEYTEIQRSKLSLYPWHLAYDNKKFLANETNIYFSYLIAQNKPDKTLEKKKKAKIILIASDACENNTNTVVISPANFQDKIQKAIDKKYSKNFINLLKVYQIEKDKPSLQKLEDFITKDSHKNDSNDGLIINFYGHGIFKRGCTNRQCNLYQKGDAIHDVEETICRECEQKLGEPQGYLLFQKSQGTSLDYINSQKFAEKIKLLKPKPVLAVITACYSALSYKGETVYNGIAQRLIDSGISAVIALPFRFTEESAKSFIESFYTVLLQPNYSLFDAFKSGIQACEPSEWYRPVLFLSKEVEDGKLFDFTELDNKKDYIKKSQSPQSPIYYLSINPMDYKKIIDIYTFCCIFSKELETITIIFRELDIKTKKT